MLGAFPLRDATLPGTRLGLFEACFICFTPVVTDFGNPVAIGGNFSALAPRCTTRSSVSAIRHPASDPGHCNEAPRKESGRSHAMLTDGTQLLFFRSALRRDLGWSLFAYGLVSVILRVPVIALVASLAQLRSQDMSFSLRHYQFDVQTGLMPFRNRLIVSVAAVTLGVVISIIATVILCLALIRKLLILAGACDVALIRWAGHHRGALRQGRHAPGLRRILGAR